ncbi:unnamed protein product, partial [Ilex paraguariensis]
AQKNQLLSSSTKANRTPFILLVPTSVGISHQGTWVTRGQAKEVAIKARGSYLGMYKRQPPRHCRPPSTLLAKRHSAKGPPSCPLPLD